MSAERSTPSVPHDAPCPKCGGYGERLNPYTGVMVKCFECKGSGVK